MPAICNTWNQKLNQWQKCTQHSIVGDFICLLAGAIMVLSFSPTRLSLAGIIALILLLFFWQGVSVKRTTYRGFLFGFGLFGVGTSWIYISIHTYGQANFIESILVTGVFVAVLSTIPALCGFLYQKIFNTALHSSWIMAFPALWLLTEFIRSHLFTGFPWLLVGYGLLNTPVAGFAPIGSVFALSLIAAITAGLLYTILRQTNMRLSFSCLIILIIIWTAGAILKPIHWTHPAGAKQTVAIVQGNISQSIKWNPQQAQRTLKIYYDLSQKHWHASLIFWPETAVPILPQQARSYLQQLEQKTLENKSALLLGIPLMPYMAELGMSPETDRPKIYNGAIILGQGNGMYLKRHLVPFGEYVPLANLFAPIYSGLNIPMSGFSMGPANQPLMHMHGIPIVTLICYEVAYPSLLRESLKNGELIANISDDAWFGDSLGPLQQEQIAQMRALETGRYVITATNNQVSSIINSEGHIIKRLARFKRGVLTGAITPMTGETPWLRWGLTPLIILMLLMLYMAYRQTRAHSSDKKMPC